LFGELSMKRVILATIASALFCASAYADSAAPAAPAAAGTTMMMSADECTSKMAQCADQACKDELVKQGCKAEEAKPAN
jgi:ABC-type sugar transport system substrate-binding protein